MRYLLDTNVVSEMARPVADPRVEERITTHAEEIALAAPTWHELRFGAARLPESRRRAGLLAFLERLAADVPVLSYDGAAAAWHARERARLATAGKLVSFIDGQIASVAATRGLTLVTRNLREMRRFEGLTVESWHR